jgi:hypothetical protein
MARPRHQNGWITEHGKQIYGNFWRYVTDPVTGERKRDKLPFRWVALAISENGRLRTGSSL